MNKSIALHSPATEPSLFSAAQWRDIEMLLNQLDARQSLWLSGYLAARPLPEQPSAENPAPPVTWILYGSETGNSETIARALGDELDLQHRSYKIMSLARLKLRELKRADYVLVICSTHGDGEPPEPAAAFFESLAGARGDELKHAHYAVLALGDSSYEHFCTAGVLLDQRFAELGGARLLARVECDVDFQAAAQQWRSEVQKLLPAGTGFAPSAATARPSAQSAPSFQAATRPSASQGTREQPLLLEVLENVCLSAPHRAKPIHHLELLLESGALTLEPGDAVGILPHNPPTLVARVLEASGLSGDEAVMIGGRALPVVEALREHLDLTIPSPALLTLWAQCSQSPILVEQAAAEKSAQRQYLKTLSVLELMQAHPARAEPQALLDAFRPLQPRLYDVANAVDQQTDEVHLTIKDFRYTLGGRERVGVASSYLRTLEPGELVRAYAHANKRFHLPEETTAPVIMIAQGTGIAPYRAFVQRLSEREERAQVWLFLQEFHREDDFLYQVDWQQAQTDGVLTNIHTLFTGDEPDRTLADVFTICASELVRWLREGAHLYVCGEKEALGGVDGDLAAICERMGESAVWDAVKTQKRLHRNLY